MGGIFRRPQGRQAGQRRQDRQRREKQNPRQAGHHQHRDQIEGRDLRQRQAKQELEVFTQVARARSGLVDAVQKGDPRQMAEANEQLTGAMKGLMIQVEAYPQIKSDQAFLRLQDELTGTENRIAVARTDLNGAVESYNTYIRKFPQVMTAKVIGAKPKEYFEVANAAAREAPKIDLTK